MTKKEMDESVNLRLPASMLETLSLIASGERTTVSEIIRRAITQYLNPTGKESG